MNYLANLNWPILTLRLRGGNSEIYRAGIWPNERTVTRRPNHDGGKFFQMIN